MQSHEIDYEIMGDDMQIVEIELDPAETVIAEAGAMNYMEDDISFVAKMGDGSSDTGGFFGKVMGAGQRMLTGESLFMTHFTNNGMGKSRVAFSAPYPGHIIPIDLASLRGGAMLCQKDAFLCAALGTKLSIAFDRKFGAGFFGGDGNAFIHAGGTVVKKNLNGETLRIDTGCIVAFSEGIDYSIERSGNLKSMLFGGEGLFLATLRGTGVVYLQSLPFSRLADRILANAPSTGSGKQTGEGSAIGSIYSMLDGK